jgi:hypothetical protein
LLAVGRLHPDAALDCAVFADPADGGGARSASGEPFMVAQWLPDVRRGAALTVELKPKWATMPRPHTVCVALAGGRGDVLYAGTVLPVKRRVCRFQQMQRYKHGHAPPSAYCPLDLFSGDAARVLSAVQALQGTPQSYYRETPADVAASGGGRIGVARAAAAVLCADPLLGRIAALQGAAWDVALLEPLLAALRAADADGRCNDATRLAVDSTAGDAPDACDAGGARADDEPPSHTAVHDVAAGSFTHGAVAAFYAATTARDVSITLSFEGAADQFVRALALCAGDEWPARVRVGRCARADAAAGPSYRLTLLAGAGAGASVACRVAVLDVDSKRGKDLAHYRLHDANIAAAAAAADGC